jgi:hypothetical protein
MAPEMSSHLETEMRLNDESNVETKEKPKIKGFDNEEHQRVYEEIRCLLDEQMRGEAQARYAVGQKIVTVMDDARYGKKAVVTIAENLGVEATLLYDARRVADTWPQEEFEALMGRRDEARGNRLYWSHFVELAGVSNSHRDLFLGRILEDGLSVRDLKRLKKELANPTPAEAPENSQSTNVMRALRNFKAESETIVEKAARYKTLIFDVLVPPANEESGMPIRNEELGTPIILELLRDARAAQQDAKQTCEEQLAKLDACIARSEEQQTTTEGDIQGTSQESEQNEESNNG